MADVLSVIQDVLNQDKLQKKEHSKMMREVQKKLKEKDSEEVTEKSGDKEEYQKFVTTMLKKFGVKSPAELAPDKKKEFYDALDAGWEGDDEKPEPGDKKKEESLGDRVKDRMKAEQEEEEDEDEDPVGDPDEDEAEEEDEPSEEQIDKIADLVVQKLKDKADEEEEEEEAPEPTEAQGGKEEKIDTKPKMEAWESSANPHARYKWIEALRQVQVNEHKGKEPHKHPHEDDEVEEARDHKGEIPEPIKPVIQSFGKKLFDYAKKSGGIDKDLFMGIAKEAMAGKLPNPKYIYNQDTDPRDFILDSMAKEFGWMYVENKYNTTFRNRRDYVEQIELAISEALNQEKVDGRRKAFKEAIRRLIYMKMKEANRQKVKEWWNVKLREDWVDNEARKVERKWSKMSKRDKMKFVDKMEDKADRSHDYTWPEVMDALDDHGIDVSKEARKQWEGFQKEDLDQSEDENADVGIIKRTGKAGAAKTDKKYKKTEDKTGIGKTPKPTQSGKPVGAKGSIGTPKPDSHIARKGDNVLVTSNEDYVKDPADAHLDPDTDKDWDLKTGWSSKKTKPAKTDKKYQGTPDKTGTSKTNPPTKAVPAGKGKGGELDGGTLKRISGDNPNKLSVGTKSGTPNKAVGVAKKAKIVDPIGKGEKGFRKEDHDAKGDSIEGPAKGLKHKCPTHVKKEEYGYGINLSHTLSENIVDKMNIYWFDNKEISYMIPTNEVQVISEGHHDESNHIAKFKSTKKIAEGYMVMPGIDRERYTEMRGLEGPFMTKSGKVVYYDPKAGMYYDRDSDIYLSYGEYMSLDRETSAQKAAMKLGPLADPKSKEYKKMERDKAKAEKKAKKDALKNQYESLGVARARKFYQKEDE